MCQQARILEEPMARYPLNLPAKLKQEAEQWAADQGVSLNQFILWSVAEKVGALKQNLDDPAFPRITYRRLWQLDYCQAWFSERITKASTPSRTTNTVWKDADELN